MPYDPKDPRAGLMPVSAAEKPPADYAGTDYVKFYERPQDEISPGVKTWYARGQNLIIAYTEVSADTNFSRTGQPDEYFLLLPDRGTPSTLRPPRAKKK